MLIIAFIFVETGTQDNKGNLLTVSGNDIFFTSVMIRLINILITILLVSCSPLRSYRNDPDVIAWEENIEKLIPDKNEY